MNTNDTRQEHIYNERIQEFFPLFDKKDDPIYNARVDFNTVKFLTERADWDWKEDKDKNKACGVILQECNKIKKAEQKLESEVQKRLKECVDDVAGVSIYGNHASITLGDDKKEFKISEFLNSDFCQKNRISGFSTLHSDGKSGMHGFVAEGGGKKIRHYVVTDGSYEMTLNWYVNGEKCTIKVNIDKEGVNLIEPNSVTEQLKKQLEVNKDVKIGGLFLHEIKFREKGKVNEVQHDGKDNQVLNKSSEIAIKSNSRDIEQEIKKPFQKHQATHINREIGSQTPPLPPLRTSSLPPKKDVFDEQVENKLGSRKPDRSEHIPNNQQQPEIPQQEGNSKSALLQEIGNFKKNNLRNTDVDDREASMEGGRKNESTSSILKTLKDKVPYLPYSNIHEHDSDNRGASDVELEKSKQPLSVPKPNSKSDSGCSSPTHANHEQSRVNSGQLKASLMNFEQRDDTILTEFISKLDKKTQKFPLKPVDQKGISEQTKEHLLAAGLLKDSSTDVKTNDSGYSSPTYTNHYNFQVSPEQLGKRLETIESKKEDTLEQLNKGLKEPSQQATKTKDLFLDSMLEKIKEGKQYDPVRELLERKVAEQENDNTNLTIDKNSELYKLLEKDAAQLKVEVIEEERKDTLTEHTDSYDRNRIALGNRNKRPLGWAKRIAESQEKDTNKSF